MTSIYNSQLEAIDKYFQHLGNVGYMSDAKVNQMLVALLLIDSIEFFKEFLTKDYIDSLNRILRNLDCCNCLVSYDGPIECEEVVEEITD